MPRWSAFVPEIDRGLVEGLNGGGEDALADLYDAYIEQVFDYAVSLVGEGKVAEALVHDVFIDAGRRAPRLRDRGRFRAWLYAAVRRRGMERSRVRRLTWDWGVPGVGRLGGVGVEEARETLEGALDRISLSDQDLLLLTFRHGVVAGDLAAVLGVSPLKAVALAGKARGRAEAALEAQLRVQEKRCLRERGGRALEGHREQCARCRRRAAVPLPVLLEAPPAPVPPPALRHRVLHTGSDPELAGYRADISGKGGNLTPEGIPRQPDVPSPLGRRWLVAGTGMVATFLVALVTSLLIPGLGRPPLWPLPDRTEKPVVTKPTGEGDPGDGHLRLGGPRVVPGPPYAQGSPEPSPVGEELTQYGKPSSVPTPEPHPGPEHPGEGNGAPPSAAPDGGGGSSQTPQPPHIVLESAVIQVDTPLVEIGAGRTAEIRFQAVNGSVSWRATTDSSKITLEAGSGTLSEGQIEGLQVSLPLSLVRLAGSAVVSITNMRDGSRTQVTVRWGLGLL